MNCLSLGYRNGSILSLMYYFHPSFSPNAVFSAGEHLKKETEYYRIKITPTHTHPLGANVPSVYLNKVNLHFHMGQGHFHVCRIRSSVCSL